MPLFLVPTPLGNLRDITQRAVDVLKEADVVACEDTRRTLGLMNHLGISKPLVSYHGHSAFSKTRSLVSQLQSGKRIALASDAGTPALSDPGERLVRDAIDAGVDVISLPGPCAAITALVASGLPTDRFFFIGFLPRRPIRARRALEQAAQTGATVVVYESPFRTRDTLEQIEAIGPEISVVVARELTKVHEEFIRGTVQEVRATLEGRDIKGEIVILFRKKKEDE